MEFQQMTHKQRRKKKFFGEKIPHHKNVEIESPSILSSGVSKNSQVQNIYSRDGTNDKQQKQTALFVPRKNKKQLLLQ